MNISHLLVLFALVAVLNLELNVQVAFGGKPSLSKDCADDGAGSSTIRPGAYASSCPEAEAIIFARVEEAVFEDPRMAASLLRLHFHDCFVNGCDASILLDDTDNFVGEKTAGPNLNSIRGFEVIDFIKADLEFVCPKTVSCADILAIAARDSVLLSGGPGWEVETGRRDSLGASKEDANNNIPGPNSNVQTLTAKFQKVGLALDDMVALSGAHTIGKARCSTFASRLNGNPSLDGAEINYGFLLSLQLLCSNSDNNSTLAELDLVTPATFDNQYYVNLLSGEGLLSSDQVLVTGDDGIRRTVESYVEDPMTFFEDFARSMLRMGRLGPLTGSDGEIRTNCRTVN
ncbi:peroxidase 40 [Punica granatum]|uniref:Peroxidase n=2 Tax=Punica granatum TaxID=22663 RepID=A0A218XTQ4_PUNGR|nr:peroxidase 40 [Punica granatum]OWM88036.1 hypothetical protein CDL15_Pgr016609 [Punica granatum]PKI48089.1 hypothetical protein CRG98_031533 [Punica granatum]